jgi:hemoglobin
MNQAGIDGRLIETLVRGVYEHVRRDPLLGPVFEARIEGWETHLQQMFAFWSSLTLRSGDYYGRPMAKHPSLPVDATHFDRWPALTMRKQPALAPAGRRRNCWSWN